MTDPSQASRTVQSRMVYLLAIASFASTSAIRVLDPAIPELSREFGISTGDAGDVMMAFSLTYGVMLFLYGPLGDRWGKYKVLTLAMLACAVSNLLIACSDTFAGLIAGRMFAATTGAAIVSLSMAWIGDHVPYEERQTTLAQFTIGSILGITTGQFVGGVFTDTVGWRGAFYFLSVIYVIVGALLWSQRRYAQELPGPDIRLSRLFSPIGTVLASRWARLVLLTILFEGAVVFGVISYVPAYLQDRHGMNAAMAGAITSLFAVGAFAYVFRAKWLIGRLGETSMVRLGGMTLLCCYLLYLFTSSAVWAIVAAIATGFAYYLVHAVLQTNATQMTPAVRGTAVALSSSCLLLGQALGVWLGGLIADAWGLGWILIVAMFSVPLFTFWFAYRLPKVRSM